MRRLPALLIVFALCLLSAVALGACGGGGSEDPQQVLEGASFKGVTSADFDASLKVESTGAKPNDLEIGVSGRVTTEGLEANATVAGTAQGKKVDFEGGLTLFPDIGFVNYQGTEYEIDASNYGFAKSLFLPALSPEAKKTGTDFASCAVAVPVRPEELSTDLQNEGTVEVDGTDTTKVSGELDVAAAGELLLELAEDPNCSPQYEALSPFPLYRLRRASDELSESVKAASIDIYVDDEGVIRRVSAKFSGDPQGGEGPVTTEFELTLSNVNSAAKIKTPTGAKPITALFSKLGINSLEFLSWATGGEGIRVLSEKVAADAFP